MQPMMFFHRNYLTCKQEEEQAGEATKNGACCGGFPWMRCRSTSSGADDAELDPEPELEPQPEPEPAQRRQKRSKRPRRDGSSSRRHDDYGELRNP